MENNNRQGCRWTDKESVKRFDKVINCLAAELPMEVWTSVHYEWIKFLNENISEYPIEPCATSSETEKRILELESELKRLYQRNELK